MRELESPQRLMEQEQAIQQVILSKLKRSTLIQVEQQEIVAYRLAEIFVAARQLYTDVLPRFLELPDTAPQPPDDADEDGEEEDEVFEVFGEVRMNMLHLRDLMEDFEESFLESLSGRLGTQEGESAEEEDDDDGP